MCFERNAMKAPDIFGAVEDMFRAMQPLFNNQTKTVITPLLATGCQVDICKYLFAYLLYT